MTRSRKVSSIDANERAAHLADDMQQAKRRHGALRCEGLDLARGGADRETCLAHARKTIDAGCTLLRLAAEIECLTIPSADYGEQTAEPAVAVPEEQEP